MSARPSAYETSHDITPVLLIEEGITLMDALYE
jgi:hypothetical protein